MFFTELLLSSAGYGLNHGFLFFFFFKQKTAYEIGLGIPAEPLFRSPTYQIRAPLRLPLVPRNGCGRPGRAPDRFLPLDITSLLLHVFFDARFLLRQYFFFSSRRRHTRWTGDWSSDVCSSD